MDRPGWLRGGGRKRPHGGRPHGENAVQHRRQLTPPRAAGAASTAGIQPAAPPKQAGSLRYNAVAIVVSQLEGIWILQGLGRAEEGIERAARAGGRWRTPPTGEGCASEPGAEAHADLARGNPLVAVRDLPAGRLPGRRIQERAVGETREDQFVLVQEIRHV